MNDAIGEPRSVTDPPTSAEALWTATERLRALEEAAPVSIVALDQDERVTIWNLAAERLFGWRASEVIGRPNPLIPDDRRTENVALRARALGGEALLGIETCCVRKDGSRVTVSLSTAPIRDAEGHLRGTMSVLTDITEAKRLEQQFLQAQKMEAIGQLAGGIAHDFNNLLTVMIGFSELVLDRVRDQPDVTADIEEIKKAGERASQLTRQLLAFSRKQLLVPQVLDLNRVVGSFEKMLSRIISEDIRFEIVTAPSLGRTKADPGQTEQLLMNLVVNARDAMPQGGTLTIATANVVLDREFTRSHVGAVLGRYVSLTVQDTGCGMTPDVLARVFEPFFTTKEPSQGTGLGLSTVYGLVKQSGGYITVESTPGVGTTVTTYLPTVDDLVESAAGTPRSVQTLEGTETILLVEDEAGVRNLLRKVLERYGYMVLQAQDADQAIAIEDGYRGAIHLLVSDMIMPRLSGPDLAQRIVRRRPAIKVLFVSGYASPEAINLVLSSQNASFLQKPFRPETLAQKVRERLDGHVGQPGQTSTSVQAASSMTAQVFASDDAGVRGASILIAEDDPGAAKAFEHMLKAEGYGVRVAPDAPSALVEVERAVPAAVVLDLHLPITDGLEVLRQLRATARHAHIPVAVVTGDYLVDERVTRELQVLGAQLYFKPLWKEDLIRIVRDLLRGT